MDMKFETLVCTAAPDDHPQLPVSSGTHWIHEEKWKDSQILTCRECGSKRVPKEKLEAEAEP